MDHLHKVQNVISDACREAGRTNDVFLLPVTKFVDPERITWAMEAGLHVFGENYPQHIRDKAASFPDARWHLIGHLQTNKVRMIVGTAELIQSVDSEHLADEIERVAAARNLIQQVLVQVNIGREPQKTGLMPDGLDALTEHLLAECTHIRLQGLMAIPPAQDSAAWFDAMKLLFDRLNTTYPLDMSVLSMGMSHDYREAVLSGATMVRIGTELFGKRNVI